MVQILRLLPPLWKIGTGLPPPELTLPSAGIVNFVCVCVCPSSLSLPLKQRNKHLFNEIKYIAKSHHTYISKTALVSNSNCYIVVQLSFPNQNLYQSLQSSSIVNKICCQNLKKKREREKRKGKTHHERQQFVTSIVSNPPTHSQTKALPRVLMFICFYLLFSFIVFFNCAICNF